ncbi:hypothetical protein KJZ67_01070 [Patescibacteria group bacterium]|nr:hypothetical protein [Patescibacteria group bacterium]
MEVDDSFPKPRSGDQIARDGGHAGAKIIRKGRTGEKAIQDYEKEHGNINIPAYKRKKGQKPKTKEAFSDN